jgi:hypothetical protein
LLTGDKNVPIQCMVSDFQAEKGDLRIKTMVLDTGHEKITGSGNINLRDETLNLTLQANPKDTSLVTLRGPILITGTFKQPSVTPQLKGPAARGAAAVALGLVGGPLAALVPFIQFGTAKNSNCGALIASAEKSVQSQLSQTR